MYVSCVGARAGGWVLSWVLGMALGAGDGVRRRRWGYVIGWMGTHMSGRALAVWELALVVEGIRRLGVLVAAAVWRRRLRTCL
jgi:hypothetical protein